MFRINKDPFNQKEEKEEDKRIEYKIIPIYVKNLVNNKDDEIKVPNSITVRTLVNIIESMTEVKYLKSLTIKPEKSNKEKFISLDNFDKTLYECNIRRGATVILGKEPVKGGLSLNR